MKKTLAIVPLLAGAIVLGAFFWAIVGYPTGHRHQAAAPPYSQRLNQACANHEAVRQVLPAQNVVICGDGWAAGT